MPDLPAGSLSSLGLMAQGAAQPSAWNTLWSRLSSLPATLGGTPTPSGLLEAATIKTPSKRVMPWQDEKGRQVLIPRFDAKGDLTDRAAIDQYRKTKQHYGIFQDFPSATAAMRVLQGQP